MSIEKLTFEQIRQENKPFTTIFNDVIQNIKDSETLGVYCYLSSLPQNWNVNKTHLMNHFEFGIDKIKKIMSWLNDKQLIEYHRTRDDQGHMGKIYILVKNGVDFISNFVKKHEHNTIGVKTTPLDNHRCENHARGNPLHINTIEDINTTIIKKQQRYAHRKKRDASQTTNESFVLPTQVNEELWKDFLQHRKDMKSPMSLVAQRRAVSALDRFIKEGHDVNAIIEQSIVNGWKGLFTVRSMENGYGKHKGGNGTNGKEEFDVWAEIRKRAEGHPGFLLNPNL